MSRKTIISVSIASALMIQGCATTGGMSRPVASQGHALNSEARITYYARYQNDCWRGPEPQGGTQSLAPAVGLFILSTGWNLLRGELARRNQARLDEFTVTYGARINTTTLSPDSVSCIAFQRDGEDGALRAVFELAPYTPEHRAAAAVTPALVIRPVGVAVTDAVARTRGASPTVNLAVTIAITAVVPTDDGPKAELLAAPSFAFKDVAVGPADSHGALGAASPVMAQLPAGAPATIVVSVTEKGSGGEFYRDLGSALEASKDATQALIESYFAED